MIIYSPVITPRISYAFEFVLNELLGLNYVFTDNLKIFERSNSLKIYYSTENKPKTKALFLKASPLLFKNNIEKQKLDVFPFKNTKAFFKTNSHSFFEFDIFAAAFYLLSRYEEYLPYTADKFGRFPAYESIAVKHDFIEQPVLNIWAEYFKATLLKYNPAIKFKQKQFQFLPTIDIDNAYAYLHKGFIRSLLSYGKLLLKLNFRELYEKTAVHIRQKKDPYDSYDYLIKLHQKYRLNPIFFFLTADYAKYDKNIAPQTKAFKKLITKINQYFEIAIHPSFNSNKYPYQLKAEKERLEKIINRKINKSRQHFLILKLPETYQNLIKLGINEDYSMGFAETAGFRAGTCNAFYFFDLKKNQKENLKIIPFSIMDVGLKDYKAYNILQAKEKIKKIIKNVKNVNGLFVSLWHNESLGTKKRWKGWQNIYEELIELALHPDGN